MVTHQVLYICVVKKQSYILSVAIVELLSITEIIVMGSEEATKVDVKRHVHNFCQSLYPPS